MKKRFSFIIIPHDKGKVFETKISLPLIYTLISLLAFLLLINLYFVIDSLNKTYQNNKLTELEKENRYLEKKLEGFNLLVSQLKGEVNSLIQNEKKIRLVFGLPEIDDEVREVGIGGPTGFDYKVGSPTLKKASLTEEELDKLLRQSKFERESFEEIYSQLLDKKMVLDHTPSITPVIGYFSRGFGMKKDPFTGMMQFHRGIDLAADRDTPIYAPANGSIIYIGHESGMGKVIRIAHGYGYETVYAHLRSTKVARGQMVKRGDLIATVGNTGYSTGPHLHYEVHYDGKAIDPLNYILCSSEFLD
ncbi:MAG: M23 family metallopeptidase [candidate division Zixibacteria bacterium]|nr:M23 family metallopeptidase [candidate division Zixibacteria bacterium]